MANVFYLRTTHSSGVTTHLKKQIYILLPILLLILGCQNQKECNFDINIGKINDSIIASIYSNPENKKSLEKYFNRIQEPNLQFEINESYRLTIYSSMSLSSKIYTIQKNKSSYKLTTKELLRLSLEKNDDTLVKNMVSEISRKEWQDFKKKAESINYWELPVEIERYGTDGSTWILEGKKPTNDKCTDRNYHMVSRWVPADSSGFKKLSQILIELGNAK